MECLIYFLIWTTDASPIEILLAMLGFFAMTLGVGFLYVVLTTISERRAQIEHS